MEEGALSEDISAETNEFCEVKTIFNDSLNHFNCTAVSFDQHEELIWVGTETGHMTSYYGSGLGRYTAFFAHRSEVRQIVPNPYGILSLTANQVKYSTRQGLKVFASEEPTMQDMQCMLHLNETAVLIGGHQEHFYELDIPSGELYPREIEIDPNVVVMKPSPQFICTGHSTGQILLRDPHTLKELHTFQAHGDSLLDFDVSGNYLVTCGFSNRFGHLSHDRFVMVYDLRSLRSFPPLQLPIEPFLLKFMTTYISRCVAVTQHGQYMLCQPDSLVTDPTIYQTDSHGCSIMDIDVSSSCQAIAFVDSSSGIHLWANEEPDKVVFNQFSQPTQFPDEPQNTPPPLSIDDESVPLSSFVLPPCSEPLFSDWPKHLTKRAYRPTPEIDPDILKNMTIRQFVGYAPNPKKTLRNQVPYKLNERKGNKSGGDRPSRMSKDMSSSKVPKPFRKVEIKYSKYGVEDFDFKQFNRTHFAGLEIHIPNAYCNAMLQAFYYLNPMRCGFQNHSCDKEFCLACELGFLFNMLDTTDGHTCQAKNFLRSFRTVREATALGLILSDHNTSAMKRNLSVLIQRWNRFVLQQLHQDTQTKIAEEEDTNSLSIVEKLFGCKVSLCNRCQCGKECIRDSTTFSFDLIYPDENDPENEKTFAAIIKNSICRQQKMQAWCDECSKYQPTLQKRTISEPPDILSLNCSLEHEKDISFWATQQKIISTHSPDCPANHTSPPKPCRYGKFCHRPGCRFLHGIDGEVEQSERRRSLSCVCHESVDPWIPHLLTLIPSDGKTDLQILRGELEEEELEECKGVVYELVTSIAHIKDQKVGGNLIAHIKVDEDFHTRKGDEPKRRWYIFNDFAITPTSENEAVSFDLEWKEPSVLFYKRKRLRDHHDTEVKPQVDGSILTGGKSLAIHQSRFSHHFTPLNASEVLNENSLVGIDAEFVTLNQEESEMKSDGTLSTLKPSQMSVARITVVRGSGTLCGVPFIDDYISTSEQVVDYLTQFSGIKPGDLDANVSSKHLTTLKTSYLKLRYLIDTKVIFVGHGLRKDFRVINLVVPRDKIIDTVDLFHLPNQRYASLKFLAWHFLKIKIQSGTHDSTEDAYTALKLYEKYREIIRQGEMALEEELQQLYDKGRQYGWQVPE